MQNTYELTIQYLLHTKKNICLHYPSELCCCCSAAWAPFFLAAATNQKKQTFHVTIVILLSSHHHHHFFFEERSGGESVVVPGTNQHQRSPTNHQTKNNVTRTSTNKIPSTFLCSFSSQLLFLHSSIYCSGIKTKKWTQIFLQKTYYFLHHHHYRYGIYVCVHKTGCFWGCSALKKI